MVYDASSITTKSDGTFDSTFINPDDLFDDEEDEVNDLDTLNHDQPELVKTFTSISSLTWSEVVKRMTGAIADLGYVQVRSKRNIFSIYIIIIYKLNLWI